MSVWSVQFKMPKSRIILKPKNVVNTLPVTLVYRPRNGLHFSFLKLLLDSKKSSSFSVTVFFSNASAYLRSQVFVTKSLISQSSREVLGTPLFLPPSIIQSELLKHSLPNLEGKIIIIQDIGRRVVRYK